MDVLDEMSNNAVVVPSSSSRELMDGNSSQTGKQFARKRTNAPVNFFLLNLNDGLYQSVS